MAIEVHPTMAGVRPTFGDPHQFDGIGTRAVYYNTETKESRDDNGNLISTAELVKGVPMDGIKSTLHGANGFVSIIRG